MELIEQPVITINGKSQKVQFAVFGTHVLPNGTIRNIVAIITKIV